ncbi:hypothetical protein NP233_g10394 [Leucocoprinus birnbaumii]|uniref:MFS general substrate transporter n=1 Tax=Leucocoprinus birnbaumii TaxID=56174 RepID=A0AAD5YRX6_9AGAR|nr:hypothetical protein NP233_g10394 [Leucocoprinus birnbaumii]
MASSDDHSPSKTANAFNNTSHEFQDAAVEKPSLEKAELPAHIPGDGKEGIKNRLEDFPDGGWRAWLNVFGAVCTCFSTFGFINSWGVFQAYYQETILKDYSPSAVAWIGSIQYALIFLPGLVVGRLFDIGYFRAVFLTCNALLLLATFLTAQCTRYWHFLLCQGIVVGVASGGLYGCSNAIMAHWFRRLRGRAVGYMSIGTALGGTVFPIVAKKLIPQVGFPWTVRIIGFMLILTTGLSILTLKRRLPPVNIKGGLFNWAVFRDAHYTVYTLSTFMFFMGLYTVLTYVSVSAVQLGVAPDLAFYFVAISNGGSLFGEIY